MKGLWIQGFGGYENSAVVWTFVWGSCGSELADLVGLHSLFISVVG